MLLSKEPPTLQVNCRETNPGHQVTHLQTSALDRCNYSKATVNHLTRVLPEIRTACLQASSQDHVAAAAAVAAAAELRTAAHSAVHKEVHGIDSDCLLKHQVTVCKSSP